VLGVDGCGQSCPSTEKRPSIYAAAQVPEYWIVYVTKTATEVYRNPGPIRQPRLAIVMAMPTGFFL